ncbi:MAG: hypothetical protein QM756_08135 [Polyangiaceae bacterium]
MSNAGARPSVFSALKLFRELGGQAVGNAYAQLARSVLSEVERLGDRNAERRRTRLARAAKSERPGAPPQAVSSAKEPLRP